MSFLARKRSAVTSSPVEQASQNGSLMRFQDRQKKRRRLLIASAVAVILIVPAILIVKSMLAYRAVLQKHTGVSAEALQQPKSVDFDSSYEAEGRVNILLLGVGDDGHAGSLLADTAMVASIDPETKDVALLSLPRDLYVSIKGYGKDKLNAVHSYAEQRKAGEGPVAMKDVVSTTLDIPIHNYIRADFTGFSKAIDTLGGVTVEVATPLYDSEYPCTRDERLACGFQLAAGTQKLNGATALKFARCRKGNCGNDFGRAARQQQLMIAAREKALSAQTLTNPAKLLGLIDAFGSHVRTDLGSDEITRLAEVVQAIDPAKMRSKVVDGEVEGLVQTAQIGGASVVVPLRSDGTYVAIQNFTHSLFFDRHIVEENAPIELVDATGSPQKFTGISERLAGYRYNIVSTTMASQQSETQLQFAPGTTAKYSLRYLEKRFNVSAREDATVQQGIRLILGSKATTETER